MEIGNWKMEIGALREVESQRGVCEVEG